MKEFSSDCYQVHSWGLEVPDSCKNEKAQECHPLIKEGGSGFG